jgi:hypothetical protein
MTASDEKYIIITNDKKLFWKIKQLNRQCLLLTGYLDCKMSNNFSFNADKEVAIFQHVGLYGTNRKTLKGKEE